MNTKETADGHYNVRVALDSLILAIRHANWAAKKLTGDQKKQAYEAKITLCGLAAAIGGRSGDVQVFWSSGHREPLLVMAIQGVSQHYRPHIPRRCVPNEVLRLLAEPPQATAERSRVFDGKPLCNSPA